MSHSVPPSGPPPSHERSFAHIILITLYCYQRSNFYKLITSNQLNRQQSFTYTVHSIHFGVYMGPARYSEKTVTSTIFVYSHIIQLLFCKAYTTFSHCRSQGNIIKTSKRHDSMICEDWRERSR